MTDQPIPDGMIDIMELVDHPENLGGESGDDLYAYVRVPEPPPIGAMVTLTPKYSFAGPDWTGTCIVVLEELTANVGFAEIDWAHGFIGIDPSDKKLHYGYAVLRLEQGDPDGLLPPDSMLMPIEVPDNEIEGTFNLSPSDRLALEERARALFAQMTPMWVKEG